MTDGIICGISGWFTPHGVRYHENVRSVAQIAPADWSMLLAHADEINFFGRPEPAPAGPSARIYHLAITSGERSRELAINDPYEAPEFEHLIRLTRRAFNDRQVLTPETMSDEAFAALLAAQEAGPGVKEAAEPSVICWPVIMPAQGPAGSPKRCQRSH